MPEQDYDYVNFMEYHKEPDDWVQICRVYLTDGKLYYEGKAAPAIKKMVEESPILKPYRKLNPYSVMRMMASAFSGSRLYATKVKKPYEELS